MRGPSLKISRPPLGTPPPITRRHLPVEHRRSFTASSAMNDQPNTRLESDSMGEIAVPADRY